MTDAKQIEELNTGLLLFIPYRARRRGSLKPSCRGYGLQQPRARGFSHRAWRQPVTTLPIQASLPSSPALSISWSGRLCGARETVEPAHARTDHRGGSDAPLAGRSFGGEAGGPSTSASGEWDSYGRPSSCARSETRSHTHRTVTLCTYSQQRLGLARKTRCSGPWALALRSG